MLFLSILVSLAFSAVAVAQTPDGFVPAVQTPLSAVFPRNITVSPAGVLLQKAGTVRLPESLNHSANSLQILKCSQVSQHQWELLPGTSFCS